MRALLTFAFLLSGLALPLPAQEPADDPLVRGDAAWERRNDGAEDERADPDQIGEAVAAYEEALAQDDQNLEVYWKLLRALQFLGDYATEDPEAKKEVFGRGRDVSEQALDFLAERAGGRAAYDQLEPKALKEKFPEPEVAAIYFWSAVNWGLWGRHYGKMAAARQGVAKRIRDYSAIVIELDPDYENGGGYRIHSRLHTEAPKIPFVTGWVDRKVAFDYIERAYEKFSGDPYNRLYYGDALLRFRKKQRGEGLEILRALVASEPRPENAVADAAAAAEARDVLADAED